MLLLAVGAGSVDALGFVVLFRLFTAHMSGNTTILGVAVGDGNWTDALLRVLPITLWVVAVGVGVALYEVLRRRSHPAPTTVLLGIEALLLGVLLVGGWAATAGDRDLAEGSLAFYALAAVTVTAMGLQTAAVRRAAGHRVRTTFVTGTLASIAEQGAVHLLDRDATDEERADRRAEIGVLAGIWTAYAIGGVIGGALALRWHVRGVVVPLALVAVLALVSAREGR